MAPARERPAIGSDGLRVDTVTLQWHLLGDGRDPALPSRTLASIAQYLPRFLLRRYGDVEPFKHRFGDPQDFIRLWLATAGSEFGGILAWDTASRCVEGSVSFPGAGLSHPQTVLRLTSDVRPFADATTYEPLITAFVAVAEDLAATYGAAYVERLAICQRGRLQGDSLSEEHPQPRLLEWSGIPPAPTWLAWFGGAYAEAVQDAVQNRDVRRSPGGLLLRSGAGPVPFEEAARVYPSLPGDLTASLGDWSRSITRDDEEDLPARRIVLP
jgi:hypothetical protein